jgi:hypothetical protein
MEKSITLNHKIPSRILSDGDHNKNSQFIGRILASAIRRASEAVKFFEERGALSESLLNRAFFMYMSVKKDAQRVIIEKIARSMGIEIAHVYSALCYDDSYPLIDKELDEQFGDIFTIIHGIAADELEYYLNYASVEKDRRKNSILLMLADLSKEFLFDVKIWYLNHKEDNSIYNRDLHESILPDYPVETVFN